jgi:hypothetical protein
LAAPAFQNALSASADVYVDEAVAGLNGNPVYIDGQSSLAGGGGIQSQLSTSGNVAVVVLPSTAFGSDDTTGIANQIGLKSHYQTIIVVNSDAVTGGVGVAGTNHDAISTLIYKDINAGQTPGAAINKNLSTINKLASGTTTSTGSGTGSSSNDAGAAPLTIVGSGIISLFVVAAVAIFFLNRNKRNKQSRVLTTGNKTTYVPSARFSKYVPENLQPLLKQLDDTARKHSKLANDALAPQLAKIINNLQELFNRIHKQGDGGNNERLAEIEYSDKLTKLVEALGPAYYLDIAEKPDLWDNPDERLHAVDQAVDAVEYQLVENIRQVNASKDLKFQVALDSLMGSKAPKVADLYKTNDDKEKEENK